MKEREKITREEEKRVVCVTMNFYHKAFKPVNRYITRAHRLHFLHESTFLPWSSRGHSLVIFTRELEECDGSGDADVQRLYAGGFAAVVVLVAAFNFSNPRARPPNVRS